MKRLLILLMMIFTTDSFASGIASNTNSAPCTNNTLETYSGNSNLSADWQPNEIQLRWYDNNTLLDVQSSANTCTYDGTLTIPQTAPTRTGYTFDGWTVRPEYDFSTLPTNEAGTERYGKGKSGYLGCYKQSLGAYEGSNCRTEDFIGEFNDLDTGEWKVIFSWGKIYGMSMCSSTTGTLGMVGTPTETSDGRYCWCRVTGYVPNGNGTRYAPTSVNWVFNSNCTAGNDGSNICRPVCAGRCALFITDHYDSDFIRALFQSGGQ